MEMAGLRCCGEPLPPRYLDEDMLVVRDQDGRPDVLLRVGDAAAEVRAAAAARHASKARCYTRRGVLTYAEVLSETKLRSGSSVALLPWGLHIPSRSW